MSDLDPDRPVGEEARKSHAARIRSGFIARYLSGGAILDIGYRGYRDDVVPIVPAATGVELDYPGYDGTTLPFADESQDAVFASHCLEHIEDFQNAFRDWFRVLRIGGFLVIMVPHQFLYEKQTGLPSRYNADHKRLYTPASLMAEIEMSLRPNSYRLRHLADNDTHFDYAIPPERHSGGCYEIELVIEKIRPPAWHLVRPGALPLGLPARAAPLAAMPVSADASAGDSARLAAERIVGPPHGGTPALRLIAAEGGDVARYDFAPPDFSGTDFDADTAASPRILALKLDHLGDFIIGLPSLRQLREAFPAAHIKLVVGSWNRAEAETCGLADEVVAYDYFPQNSLGWDGTPHERVEKFRALTAGRHYIAIDLRVDDDTRFLLGEVDAALRCGIGAVARHKYLDVALPPEHAVRDTTATEAAGPVPRLIEPDHFESRMPFQHFLHHETDFRPVEGHAVFGPNIVLPAGHFTVLFDLRLTGWTLGLGRTRVTLDVARDGSEIVALRRLRPAELRGRDGFALSFDNAEAGTRYEFRVHIAGRPWRGRLCFAGVRLAHREAENAARYRRAELHIGEQLSLLVRLVAERTTALYPKPFLRPELASPELAGPEPADQDGKRRIAVAPFSNSDLRDWPLAHYASLVRLLVERLDCTVTLLGSRAQAARLDRLAEEAGGGARIVNLGGQTAWADLPALLRGADLVICNNSGIAHLAASRGARTLALYSGSHQPQEWGPRGRRAHALMAVVPCSPCGHDRLADCPNEHRCMRDLLPETVFDEACRLLAEAGAVISPPPLAAPLDTAP